MGRRPIPPSEQADRHLERMKVMEKLAPAINLMIQKQMTLEEFMEEAAPIALMRLTSLVMSDDHAIAFKAAQEILNRQIGKPMERKQILSADVGSLNPNQIDNEIKKYLETETTPTELKEIVRRQRRPKVADIGNNSSNQ